MHGKLLVFGALLLGGQGAAAAAEPVPAALMLDHVGIQAADIDRSAAFYTGILGLAEVPAPFPRAAVRWFALGGGRLLHIVGGGRTGVGRNRWDHFALACADLDALIAQLDQKDVAWADMTGKHEVQTRPDGVRQIFVRDPDGYYIELNDAGKRQ